MNKKFDFLCFFPPSGRHAYLDAKAVKKLVVKIRPDKDVYVWVEKSCRSWRLRVSYILPNQTRVRRGITLPDDETAEWVRAYFQKSGRKNLPPFVSATLDDSAISATKFSADE